MQKFQRGSLVVLLVTEVVESKATTLRATNPAMSVHLIELQHFTSYEGISR